MITFQHHSQLTTCLKCRLMQASTTQHTYRFSVIKACICRSNANTSTVFINLQNWNETRRKLHRQRSFPFHWRLYGCTDSQWVSECILHELGVNMEVLCVLLYHSSRLRSTTDFTKWQLWPVGAECRHIFYQGSRPAAVHKLQGYFLDELSRYRKDTDAGQECCVNLWRGRGDMFYICFLYSFLFSKKNEHGRLCLQFGQEKKKLDTDSSQKIKPTRMHQPQTDNNTFTACSETKIILNTMSLSKRIYPCHCVFWQDNATYCYCDLSCFQTCLPFSV